MRSRGTTAFVTAVFPAGLPSFADGVLVLGLYGYDPWLADVHATWSIRSGRRASGTRRALKR
jgi:hypothetical protein